MKLLRVGPIGQEKPAILGGQMANILMFLPMLMM